MICKFFVRNLNIIKKKYLEAANRISQTDIIEKDKDFNNSYDTQKLELE